MRWSYHQSSYVESLPQRTSEWDQIPRWHLKGFLTFTWGHYGGPQRSCPFKIRTLTKGSPYEPKKEALRGTLISDFQIPDCIKVYFCWANASIYNPCCSIPNNITQANLWASVDVRELLDGVRWNGRFCPECEQQHTCHRPRRRCPKRQHPSVSSWPWMLLLQYFPTMQGCPLEVWAKGDPSFLPSGCFLLGKWPLHPHVPGTAEGTAMLIEHIKFFSLLDFILYEWEGVVSWERVSNSSSRNQVLDPEDSDSLSCIHLPNQFLPYSWDGQNLTKQFCRGGATAHTILMPQRVLLNWF